MLVSKILHLPFWGSPFISGVLTILIFYIAFKIAWSLRLKYLRYLFITQQNQWVLLEIKLPGEIRRSPEAMEQFLINALWWTKGDTNNFYKKYIKGEMLLTYSLEIVSIGGGIHFFIQTPIHLKDLVQTQMYAQYPQVEMREVADYVDRIPYAIAYKNSPSAMFGWEFKLKKPDAIPIKTYKQWGYDKSIESLEPDQQIDPLVPLIEKIAAIDPWEEIWIQMVIRAHKDDDWRDEGQKVIDDLIDSKRKKAAAPDEEGTPNVLLTAGEKDFITAIESNTDKHAFDVGIRTLYITHQPSSFKVSRINYIKNLFLSFDAASLNSLASINPSGYDNPWEDYNEFLENTLKNRMLERYRLREFFDDKPMQRTWVDGFLHLLGNYRKKTFILTTEELATIFHLPGGTYQSTSIERTDLKKAQPPTNLPIG